MDPHGPVEFDVVFAALPVAAPGSEVPRGLIGCSKCRRGLPWDPAAARADMSEFLRRVCGRGVVVGRATADRLPGEIRGAAQTVVLTKSGAWGATPATHGGWGLAATFDDALAQARAVSGGDVPVVAGGASVLGQALAHPGLRFVHQTQISPAALVCDHGEGDRTYTDAYGPFGLLPHGLRESSPPTVLAGAVGPHLLRTYGPADVLFTAARAPSPKRDLVLLCGKRGAGKTATANAALERAAASGRTAGRRSFATPLKNVLARLLALFCAGEFPTKEAAREVTERRLVDDGAGGTVDSRELVCSWAPAGAPSVRELLQHVGTDVLRAELGDDVFVGQFLLDVSDAPEKLTVVDDLRFVSEYAGVLGDGAAGGRPRHRAVAALVVPPSGGTTGGESAGGRSTLHRSETEHAKIPFDLVLWNPPEAEAGRAAAETLVCALSM